MVGSEQAVWMQYALRSEKERPAASHVSAALSAFSTLFQRSVESRDDVSVVFRLAECWRDLISNIDTSVKPLPLNVSPSNVPTNIGGVSAAERLVLTSERVSDVLGKVVIVYEHGNFAEKEQVLWGYGVRQVLQPPHTKLLKQDDLDFLNFVERDGPVPNKHVPEFWENRWKKLPTERQEWAQKYKKPDSLRTRYWRLKERKKRMGFSA
jgi:hypothetical protein